MKFAKDFNPNFRSQFSQGNSPKRQRVYNCSSSCEFRQNFANHQSRCQSYQGII